MRLPIAFAAAAAFAAALAVPAFAADSVKIGALYPLTGNSAPAGQAAKAAVELGVEIVNAAHPELKGLPLADSAGLPNLGGAKIDVIHVDHQGDPSVGQQQTLRLITQEHVAALLGVYHSSVALTATAVAERYGVPFVVGDSVAANITQRGFKWTFRVTPIATDFAAAYTEFLKQMKTIGKKVDSIAILNENTDYGTSVGGSIAEAARKGGFDVQQIVYNAKSTDVSAQVLQLKEKKPDVAIFVGYTADEILYMKTLRDLDYMPSMIIGDDAGFSDPSFIPAVGDLAQGVLDRSAWAVGAPGSVTFAINEMYKARTGRDLDDTSGRWMQALLVLADAINRAGSTDPAKIQQALQETDLKPAQLMMGYRGVKFDAAGQNILASTYLIQLQGKAYKAVWPETRATAQLQWPMTGWK
ncbi:MAG TPA: ABC transporter substrate-binding protein [Stellaceae bacterium]|nr:ABC transporter substrate-binding protein [Stellaceae bacterium]